MNCMTPDTVATNITRRIGTSLQKDRSTPKTGDCDLKWCPSQTSPSGRNCIEDICIMLQRYHLLPNLLSTDLETKLSTSFLLLTSSHSQVYWSLSSENLLQVGQRSAALSWHTYLLGWFQWHKDHVRQDRGLSQTGEPCCWSDLPLQDFYLQSQHPPAVFCDVLFASNTRTTACVVENGCYQGRKWHHYA